MISYLAIPYTWNPAKSFEIANKVAAKLMQEGKLIFSPINHSHVIADHMDDSFRLSQEFWMAQDIPMLSICGEMIMIIVEKDGLDLIVKSSGCMSEKSMAEKLGIPIHFYQYEE